FATIQGTNVRDRELANQGLVRVETVTIWDATSGQEVRTLRVPDQTPVACNDVALDSGFGRIAWARGNGTIEIQDLATGRLIVTIPAHTDLVWRVAFSPDGRQLASASRDGSVGTWDAATGLQIHVRPGFRNEIRGFGFSPDGRRLTLEGWDLGQLHPD